MTKKHGRKFRARTEEEGLKTGDALTQAIKIWIKKKDEESEAKKPNPRLILKIKPVVVGKRRDTVKSSP